MCSSTTFCRILVRSYVCSQLYTGAAAKKDIQVETKNNTQTKALDHVCCNRLCEGGELKDFLLGANKKKKTWQVYMNKQSSREPFWSADSLWRLLCGNSGKVSKGHCWSSQRSEGAA